jgi:hypothetical protein
MDECFYVGKTNDIEKKCSEGSKWLKERHINALELYFGIAMLKF